MKKDMVLSLIFLSGMQLCAMETMDVEKDPFRLDAMREALIGYDEYEPSLAALENVLLWYEAEGRYVGSWVEWPTQKVFYENLCRDIQEKRRLFWLTRCQEVN